MRKNIQRRSNNFLGSRDESQSDEKIICLESYVTMSYKTPRKEKEKIQPPQNVELSEYNKVYYQIYVYKLQDCQRRKGCC